MPPKADLGVHEDMQTKCPHCGANLFAYWFPMRPGLVFILEQSHNFVERTRVNRFHPLRDLRLIGTSYATYSELGTHGLWAHSPGKGSFWLITANGFLFLNGKLSIPREKKTWRKTIIGVSEDLVNIEEARKLPDQQIY